jgi:hypothetical protein
MGLSLMQRDGWLQPLSAFPHVLRDSHVHDWGQQGGATRVGERTFEPGNSMFSPYYGYARMQRPDLSVPQRGASTTQYAVMSHAICWHGGRSGSGGRVAVLWIAAGE